MRASSAVPAVFQPVKIGQREYVDGGLSAPIPVQQAREMGAEFVIAVDISAIPEGNPTGDAARMLMQTFAIMGKSLKAYELRDADVVLQPALAGVSGADFTTRRQSIKAGRDVTLAHLGELRERLAARAASERVEVSRSAARRARAAQRRRAPESRRSGRRRAADAATTPMAAAIASIPPAAPCGHSTWPAKKSARLTITPTTAAVIAVSGAVKRRSPCVASISGPPRRMKQNDGRKVKNVTTAAAATPRQEEGVRAEHGVRPAADEADEGDHHDQRPRRRLAERQPVDHLPGAQPVVLLDRALEHVGQHRIGAAEGEQRGLGEEPGHLRQDRAGTERRRRARRWRRPRARARSRGRARSGRG